ncbi:MAG: hypothetical protein K2Q13_03895 [Nitrosomonas sp.]|uniref:hypothetical protein n=1 Tax=Nitrosomonas sp. TaxID=42353 RepID=UPI0025F10566|nr:hypothetical protein [Nitrosomonas sp.]MBY0474189.1 hypothetical protein [Nitrosomonas sp.]
MIPYDTKDFRANQPGWLRKYVPHILAAIALMLLLSWLDKMDRESYLNEVQAAAAAQCIK